jgi:hypothetical protein
MSFASASSFASGSLAVMSSSVLFCKTTTVFEATVRRCRLPRQCLVRRQRWPTDRRLVRRGPPKIRMIHWIGDAASKAEAERLGLQAWTDRHGTPPVPPVQISVDAL